MASVNGLNSIGVDLNPAMKVIASAKQAVKSDIDIITVKLKEINAKSKVLSRTNDHLNIWFDPSAVDAIRKIEYCILGGVQYESTLKKVNSLSNAQCLMYTCLFNCVRGYLADFIPTNPTWVKKPKNLDKKLNISWVELKKQYVKYVQDLMKGISVVDHEWPRDISKITVGSSLLLPVESASIDFILTSPPYCTRIDYGIATLPELAILCVAGEIEADSIRRQLMGTTTVPKEVESGFGDIGGQCASFLSAVKSHTSKASKTYYYKNFLQYFISLSSSISEIERVLKPGSKFVCVVQDSFYKNIHCDLPRIISEMAGLKKLKLKENIEFESKRNMANLNTKSKQYRSKSSAVETVLIFVKGE